MIIQHCYSGISHSYNIIPLNANEMMGIQLSTISPLLYVIAKVYPQSCYKQESTIILALCMHLSFVALPLGFVLLTKLVDNNVMIFFCSIKRNFPKCSSELLKGLCRLLNNVVESLAVFLSIAV